MLDLEESQISIPPIPERSLLQTEELLAVQVIGAGGAGLEHDSRQDGDGVQAHFISSPVHPHA